MARSFSPRRLFGRVAAVATFFLAAAVVVPAATAGAQSPSKSATGTDRNGTYLALGDSVAFGYVPPTAVSGMPNYEDAHSFVSYANDVARALGERVANASCPGETTASMLTVHAQSNGCENSVTSTVGYRTLYPLHEAYQGSQMSYALQYLADHHDTKLVTIDIGANDAFVCEETAPNRCTTATELGAVGAKIETNLVTIFSEIRDVAHYTGPLVLLDYYSLTYRSPFADAQSQFLNTVINAAATYSGAFHVTIANGYTAFKSASKTATGSPCKAGLLIPVKTGGCNIHPTLKGHAVLATAILTALKTAGA